MHGLPPTPDASHTHSARTCARRGCAQPVKKPTGKYCSVQCCAIDPERNERLRVQARRAGRRTVLPLSRQLSMPFTRSDNPEALLARLCEGREDTPMGMSRLGGLLNR